MGGGGWPGWWWWVPSFPSTWEKPKSDLEVSVGVWRAFKLGGLEVCVDNFRLTFSIITSDASSLLTLITTGVSVGMEVKEEQEQQAGSLS